MEMYKYLFLTLIIELPVVLLAYKNQWKTSLLIGLLLNLFSWPILTLLYHYSKTPLLALEAGVFVVESIGYAIFLSSKWQKAALVSFIANLASLLIGVYINGINLFS